MDKHEQVYIYVCDKVCVYNGVYEGNIPVSMIHLYTRGSGLILGERPMILFKAMQTKYLQETLGLIPTWRPMIFLGRFKGKPSFLISYSKKIKLIEIYTKVCLYKKGV